MSDRIGIIPRVGSAHLKPPNRAPAAPEAQPEKRRQSVMPLINSPIDGAPMRQINRYGIEFDVCPTTGGIWLDRGELEKLIALVKQETLAEASPRQARHREDDDYDDDRRGGRHGGKRSRLADIFDF